MAAVVEAYLHVSKNNFRFVVKAALRQIGQSFN